MNPGESPRIPRWLILLLGYGISIACMFWVYRGYDWSEQVPRLLATDLSWVIVAVAFNVGTYIVQGLCWSLLLNQVGSSDRLRATQAIFIGLFANEVLPLRPGEVIRCYLQRRWTGLPLEVVLSSALIERIIDGVIIIIGFFVVTRYVTLPGILVQGSRVLLLVLLMLMIMIASAIIYRRRTHELIAQSRWKDILLHVVNAVDAMGSSKMLFGVIALSFVFMSMQIVPIWALMKGFNLNLTAWDALVAFVVLRLATVVPFSPGNVGPFQGSIVLALTLLNIPRDLATSYATLLFFVITVPLWLAGFVALVATRMRLDELHKDAHEPAHANGK